MKIASIKIPRQFVRTRQISKLNISRESGRQIFDNDLQLHKYKIMVTQEL